MSKLPSTVPDGMRIDVTKNGPYIVKGGVPLHKMRIVRDENDNAIDWEDLGPIDAGDTYALCRCGHSENKPFCDGAHVAAGFDGTETASKDDFLDAAEVLRGTDLTMYDNKSFCIGAGYCHGIGSAWALSQVDGNTDVGIDDKAEAQAFVEKAHEIAILEVAECPSGRLVLERTKTGEVIEPDFGQPSIALIEDTSRGISAALWVRGGIPIFDEAGEAYEVRNRVTLCRCGQSSNKPFCDGRHYEAGFSDNLL
jgi:CDGSH-type Zn-finger protein